MAACLPPVSLALALPPTPGPLTARDGSSHLAVALQGELPEALLAVEEGAGTGAGAAALLLPPLPPPAPTLLLLCTPGADAEGRVAAAAAASQPPPLLTRISLGSADAREAALAAVQAGVRAGGWVLLCNVHLEEGGWVSRLCASAAGVAAAVSTGRAGGVPAPAPAAAAAAAPPHPAFRLILTAQVPSLTGSSSAASTAALAFPNQLPASLLATCSKLLLETRPGTRATFLGSLERVRSLLGPGEGVLAPLAARAAWAHMLVMERRRYAPFGWSKAYDFGEGDLECAVATLRLLSAGEGGASSSSSNSSSSKALLPALRRLLAEAVYGARLESPVDEGIMGRLVGTALTGEIVSLEALLLREGGASAGLSGASGASGSSSGSGSGMGPLRCPGHSLAAAAAGQPGSALGVWEAWAQQQLPGVCSPTVLGLSAQTDTQQLVRAASELLRIAAQLRQ